MPRKQRESVWIQSEHWHRYLELFAEGVGITPASRIIQKEFNMPVAHSRQAVSLKCYKEGVKPPVDNRGGGGRGRGVDIKSRAAVAERQTPGELSLELAEEIIIKWAGDSKRLPQVEAELNRALNKAAAYKDQYESLEKWVNSQEDKARRFMLAQQQGEIKSPSIAGKPSKLVSDCLPNLTYHIALYDPEIVANTVPLLNISEGAFSFS